MPPSPRCYLLALIGLALVLTPRLAAADEAAEQFFAALKPGHWSQVPDSQMSHVFYAGPLADQVRGTNGPSSVIAAWGGGALDTKRNRLVLWGGGHRNYAGNEVYAFDIGTLRWMRLTDPSPIAGYDDSGIYPDGAPASHHSYGGIAYIPAPIDRLFVQGGARYASGAGDTHTWFFDFATKKWTRRADSPATAYGDIAAYDPVTRRVWMEVGGTHGYLLDYDPAADRWTAHGSIFSESISYYMTGAIDPERRLLVAAGNKVVCSWKLGDSVSIVYNKVKTEGDTEAEEKGSPGFVFYPPGHDFVAWVGGTTVYTLDPADWKWTAHPAAADNKVAPTAPAGTGTFGRFQYVPSKGVFVLVNDAGQNVFFYRPAFAAAH